MGRRTVQKRMLSMSGIGYVVSIYSVLHFKTFYDKEKKDVSWVSSVVKLRVPAYLRPGYVMIIMTVLMGQMKCLAVRTCFYQN
jgi:hypothetical protein